MLHAIRSWLSPTAQLVEQVKALRARVETLERSELERETILNDQLDKLARMIKRVRARADREQAAQHELPGIDPVSAAILARRGRVHLPGNDGGE
jgi:transposase